VHIHRPLATGAGNPHAEAGRRERPDGGLVTAIAAAAAADELGEVGVTQQQPATRRTAQRVHVVHAGLDERFRTFGARGIRGPRETFNAIRCLGQGRHSTNAAAMGTRGLTESIIRRKGCAAVSTVHVASLSEIERTSV
jgi:hypothetical protein